MGRFPYFLFLAALAAFNALIFITPYLAMQGYDAQGLYSAFSITCHQLTSRSLCLIKSAEGGLSIGDCLPTSHLLLTKAEVVHYPDSVAYKFPVCARDVAIYLSMLIGLIMLPFFKPVDSEDWPNKWILVAAAIPIAIDGTTQLVGMRESTNLLRLITGAIIGIVLPFYLLPLLNSIYSFLRGKFAGKKEAAKATPAAARRKAGKKKQRKKKARR